MAAKARNKWASQAQQAAVLRYSPQREALRQAAQEAREQFEATLAGSESSSRLGTAAIDTAQPRVQGIYDRAQGTQSAAQGQLAGVLAALGPAATGFKAAGATEAAAGQGKLARERADTEGGLQTQRAAAAEAPAFARTLAGQQLAKSLSKIFATQQGIAGQEGSAAATERAKLENEAEGRNVTKRGQDLTAKTSAEGRAQKATEHQEDLAQKRAEHSGAPDSKPLTRKEQNEGASTIHTIAQYAGEAGTTRAERVAALTEGGVSTSRTYKAGEKLPNGQVTKQNTSISSKATPAFKPDVLMSAALDLAEYHGITRNTAHRLQSAGYNVKSLELPLAKASPARGVTGGVKAGR